MYVTMRLLFCSSLFLLFRITFTLDLCTQHGNCRDCVRDVNKCVWCNIHKLNDTKCKSETLSNLENWCPNNMMNPKSIYNITKNNTFSSEIGKVVQLQPQQIKMNIRPGDSINFNLSYKTATNYPIDLYFLFDGTKSMADAKADVITKAETIYKTLKTWTDNIHLGVGFFGEKNLLPFTKLLNNTNIYSFRNILELGDDPGAFKKAITDITFDYELYKALNDLDTLDGLDALAQIIVCKEQIGWREESRKIIIVLTGAGVRVAGDGLFGGLTKPYDGNCYTKDNIYTKEREMDYPSVGLISKLASENEINIIFALSKGIYYNYDVVVSSIRGSQRFLYPGKGIVNILKTAYEKITQTLKLKVNMKPEYRDYIDISSNPDCYHAYNNYIDCDVQQNKEKNITVTLNLTSFLEANDIKIDVNIEGIKEKLGIDVAVIGDCDCNKDIIPKSSSCNHHGSLQCGTCECETSRYYGDSCQCDILNDSNPEDQASCIANDTKTVCNNRGSCSCGMCKCRIGYKGPFCECSDYSCKRGSNNELCSGPDNGDCDCGVCKCKSGWQGSVCDCPISKTKCISSDKSICSNRSICSCGQCACDPISQWDVRTKQQTDCSLSCPEEASCHSRQCLNIAPIVLCYLDNKDCQHSETVNITVVKNLSLLQSQSSWYHCSKVIVDVGCYTKFLYRYLSDSYGIEVIMDKEIDCVEANFLWGGICLVTLIVVGVGTLIVWKIWTDRIDRLEYEQLFKQATGIDHIYTSNDVFRPPTKTYENPQYK